jgi:hypothetical protein
LIDLERFLSEILFNEEEIQVVSLAGNHNPLDFFVN